jgi:hypothetical protein
MRFVYRNTLLRVRSSGDGTIYFLPGRYWQNVVFEDQ